MLLTEDYTIGYDEYLVKPTILALIGKPLSGKDTQADLLVAAHPEAVKISTGHIIRAVAEEGETHRFWPIIGPYISMMEKGLKLPDEPTLAMLKAVMQEQIAEGKKLLVIAGSPRGMEQLDGFDAMAREFDADFRMIHLAATDLETYRRSAFRNEGRVDDTPEVHKVRLEEYETYVSPMVRSLQEAGRMKTIDAMRPVEQVFAEVESVVRPRIHTPEGYIPMYARR